jgi:hypothetical protein
MLHSSKSISVLLDLWELSEHSESLQKIKKWIFNVLIICLCVFLMFAILGMNLLQGKLNFCNVTGSQLVYNKYGPYNLNQTQC